MRLRWRVRSLLVGIALLATGLAAWVAIERRAGRFRSLAAYHLPANGILVDQAGGGLECVQVGEDETLEAAVERVFAARGGQEYLASKAAMYHWALFEKYRAAAATPWRSVAADPPSPPMANPPFHPDAGLVRVVRDRDKPSTGEAGFR